MRGKLRDASHMNSSEAQEPETKHTIHQPVCPMARKDANANQSSVKRKHGEEQTGSDTVETESEWTSFARSKKIRWNKDAADDTPGEEIARSKDDDFPEEDNDMDEMQETCLCITGSHGKVAAAYYDSLKRVLYVSEDTQESPHMDLCKMLLEQVKADTILSSSRADERLIRVCQEHAEEFSSRFQIRPHREFIPEKGRGRLLSLNIFDQPPLEASPSSNEEEPKNAYDFMRSRKKLQGEDPAMKRWKASIRAQNYAKLVAPLSMAAIGALLDHLVRIHAAGDLEDQGISGLDVVGIELLALDQVMQIDTDALTSLQVFCDQNHASVHSNRTKEGLSLFGILDKTRTSLGRALLRQWLLRPCLDIPVILARYDAVECFSSSDNLDVADAIRTHLGGLKNLPRTLGFLRSGKGSLRDWASFVKATFHACLLRETVCDLSSTTLVPIVQKLLDVLDTNTLKTIGSGVNETIDWEMSQNEERVCVRHLVDPELDEKKRIYNSLSIFLSEVALKVAEGIPPDKREYAKLLNVLYFPQLGYLITVPFTPLWRESEGFDAVPDWTFQFSTEEHLYFKSQDMHDLDYHIGDLKSMIMDREIEIIHALQMEVIAEEQTLLAICNVCAELDCLLSLALATRQHDLVRPIMTERNIIEIRNGRHPLQELCEDTFVPNSLKLYGGIGVGVDPNVAVIDDSMNILQGSTEEGPQSRSDEKRSVLVCTGANACGKSVYIKQNALIVIMAQVGCFVPAESATLGVVDKIFTRIQTKESIAKVSSAFMIDLSQVSMAIRNSTARSMIILDEFGKGTLSADGAGLLCGVLNHLLSRGPECPKVLVATHFHEIFRNDLLRPSLPIFFAHMEVIATPLDSERMEQGTEGDEIEMKRRLLEQFTFLYRVAPGLSLDSYATHCALINGVPRRVVERARYVSSLLLDHNITTLLDEQMSEKEEEEMLDAESVIKRFCEMELSGEEGERDVRRRLRAVLGTNDQSIEQ